MLNPFVTTFNGTFFTLFYILRILSLSFSASSVPFRFHHSFPISFFSPTRFSHQSLRHAIHLLKTNFPIKNSFIHITHCWLLVSTKIFLILLNFNFNVRKCGLHSASEHEKESNGSKVTKKENFLQYKLCI